VFQVIVVARRKEVEAEYIRDLGLLVKHEIMRNAEIFLLYQLYSSIIW